jgi:hypothetical protein
MVLKLCLECFYDADLRVEVGDKIEIITLEDCEKLDRVHNGGV